MEAKTLLFADLVDSTARTAGLGELRAAEMWAEHDRRARQLLARHDGLEIDRSDGFFLVFHRPAEALRFAVAYHGLVAELGLAARVGIHHARVTLRRNPAAEVARGAKPVEVEGLAKPLAARIMALADGGRTLLSADAAAALAAQAPVAPALHRHGFYRLKGIDEPIEIVECHSPQSAATPPADRDKAYRVVRVGDLWQPARQVRHNLVPERDAFVGRQAELRQLADRLDAGVRLLTLLGPGGTGKTRLARRYALMWLGDWPGGAFFCDLSEARSLEGIHFAVALALGVPLGRGDAGVQLGHAIAGHGACLLILDNFEQVSGHAAATLGRWLDGAPQARFVVTSRERLHLAGEETLALEPLALADDAITLFAERARAQRPEFAITDDNRAAVADIVRLLDGLPLAIELAAARVRVLSPAQILQRLGDRFVLLAGARGVAARQATLKAAIDWSWDLLTPWEQAALAQCAVFEGGFTLEAAEAVVQMDRWPEAPAVLDAIQSLVDKSLLRAWLPKSSGRLDIAEPYFGMFMSIHEYASHQLRACGAEAEADAQLRHGRYFAGFGDREALAALSLHGGSARRRLLALELDNLVSACRRATQRRQADIAAGGFLAAWAVLEAQGPLSLGWGLGEQVAALDGLSPDPRWQVQLAVADANYQQGRVEAGRDWHARALAVARACGDRSAEARVLQHLATASHRQGCTAQAQEQFAAALAIQRLLPERAPLGVLYANLANQRFDAGQMAEARASYEAALAIHREVGNRAAEGIVVGNLGTLHHELGQLTEARAAYDAALRIHRETGSLQQEAVTLGNLGILLGEQGEQQAAAGHYAAALQIHRETGNRRGQGVVLGQIGDLHRQQGETDAARANYEQALGIHREVGNRRFEGGVCGSLGELLAGAGQVEQGLELLRTGERLLRAIDDPLSLAKLLCARGRAALAFDDEVTARATLAEAVSLAERLGAEAGSDLGRQIDALRGRLA